MINTLLKLGNARVEPCDIGFAVLVTSAVEAEELNEIELKVSLVKAVSKKIASSGDISQRRRIS